MPATRSVAAWLLLALLATFAAAQTDGASVASAAPITDGPSPVLVPAENAVADSPGAVIADEVTNIPIEVAPSVEEEAPAATAAAAAAAVIDSAAAADPVVQQPTMPVTEPAAPSRRARRYRHAGNPGEDTVQAQARLINQRNPSPVTLVTCRLDASGNVAGLVLAKADGSNWASSCATGTTSNIQLDFQDTQILQVQEGRRTATGAVAWYSFRTDFDVRTCGNAKAPTDVVKSFGWYDPTDAVYTSATRPTTQRPRKFLGAGSNLAPATWAICRSTTPRFNGLASATFNADLVSYEASFPGTVTYGRSIGYGLAPCCTTFFANARDFPVDNTCCEAWLLDPATRVNVTATPTCPPSTSASPNQWALPITRKRMPAARPSRPATWTYRAVNPANVAALSVVQPVAGANPAVNSTYYTVMIQHDAIPGVSGVMLNWWFNGGFEGEMVWQGATFPRFLLAHPRDHVTQDTVVRSPTPGSTQGATWNIMELFAATASFTSSSIRAEWAKNIVSNTLWRVTELTATVVQLQLSELPIAVRHTWTAAINTQVTSTLTIGSAITPQSTNEAAAITAKKNAAAAKFFGGDCINSALNRWTQHTVEEMGNFQHFLPGLYTTAGAVGK